MSRRALVAAVAGMWDAARAFGILGLVCAVLWQAVEQEDTWNTRPPTAAT